MCISNKGALTGVYYGVIGLLAGGMGVYTFMFS